MSRILYIESSPRGTASSSSTVSTFFLDELLKANPTYQIKTINLWERDLPELNSTILDAKYNILHGVEHTAEQKQAWFNVENIISEFKSYDKYVISVPMWNFSIPYVLKHYFDLLIQPGYTFSYSSTGYKGLVTDKPILVVYSRGSSYSENSVQDFQKSYMETVLKFIGFTNIQSIIIEPTFVDPAKKSEIMNKCLDSARTLANHF